MDVITNADGPLFDKDGNANRDALHAWLIANGYDDAAAHIKQQMMDDATAHMRAFGQRLKDSIPATRTVENPTVSSSLPADEWISIEKAVELPEYKQLVTLGQKIDAIKFLRNRTNLGLREVINFIGGASPKN
jgi:hypothetical protein